MMLPGSSLLSNMRHWKLLFYQQAFFPSSFHSCPILLLPRTTFPEHPSFPFFRRGVFFFFSPREEPEKGEAKAPCFFFLLLPEGKVFFGG